MKTPYKSKDWAVCSWDSFGQFWKRLAVARGTYAKQDAESLAKHWNATSNGGFEVKPLLHTVQCS